MNKLKFIGFTMWAILMMLSALDAAAQAPTPTPYSSVRYLDPIGGLSADKAVELALSNNGELKALRKEVDSAKAMVKQANSRPNPILDTSGAVQIGGSDNNQMAEIMLPLELGGRRASRVAVAQRESEIRELEVANQERILASDVRLKFGEAYAFIRKLEVAEQTLAAVGQGYGLVSARVTEGKTAPLEQNMLLVEVNRLRSVRETNEGKVEIAMLELRNMIGLKPEDPLRLKVDTAGLVAPLPSVTVSTGSALNQRPDLQAARAAEQLATAKIVQAEREGRIDASVKGGYQRMNSSFMLSGYDDRGILRPIQEVMLFITFGVELMLPVRNRNKGAVEAAAFDLAAAKRRTEFGELTIRREVASSYTRYEHAARSLGIIQNGVSDPANSNLQVVWQTYELGSRSLLDYIAEERRFFEVQNELIEAEFETYAASIEIMRATNAPELKKK